MRRLAPVALLCCLPALAAEQGGQADIVLQGYSLGGNAQAPERIAGAAIDFRDFLPHFGILSGNLEAYGNGQFQTGQNFLELQGLPWLGRRWTFRGGDFQMPASLVDFPFYNIFNPEVNARGVRIAAGHGAADYEFFYGRETIEEGPQVPFRIYGPQSLAGASARYRKGRLEAGLRYTRYSSTPGEILNESFLFPPGRGFARIDTFAAQALLRLVRNLRLYGEGSEAMASRPVAAGSGTPSPFSTLAGLAWETPKLAARANYASLGANYFPLAGYFAGDRQGPFAEIQYRPWKGFEAQGSVGRYRNNRDDNPDVATYRSTSISAGVTARSLWGSTATAQLSNIRFSARPAGGGPYDDSSNRHLSAGLAHPFRRHTVRLAVHDLKFAAGPLPERQHWAEAEDTFRIKQLILGANVRMQQAVGSQRQNTVYVRGIAEFHTRRFTAYGNVETGNDLINQTVFATNTYRTSAAGITAHLDKNWDLQLEAFRNTLNMALNPESIFVLESGGVGLSNALTALDQWSVFIRVKRSLQWGRPLPSGDLDQYVRAEVPLFGSLEGFVHERRVSGDLPAAGIPVSLDSNRTVTSGADGRFRFSEVAEGVHRVMVSQTELPADYDPGDPGQTTVAVHPRRITRADFTVLRLTSLSGRVEGPENAPLGNILIRLAPLGRYTTTGEDGRFVFHNLREGDYEAALDPATLPEGSLVAEAARLPAVVRLDAASPEIRFRFQSGQKPKAVRKVELR